MVAKPCLPSLDVITTSFAIHNDRIADSKLCNVRHVVDTVIIDRQRNSHPAAFLEISSAPKLAATVASVSAFRSGLSGSVSMRVAFCADCCVSAVCAGAQYRHRKGQQNCQYFSIAL